MAKRTPMTLGTLIAKLQELEKKHGSDINVDCNDMDGGYSAIQYAGYQKWEDHDGKKHEVVSIYHSGYNKDDSLIH